jgi:polyhydroxyalkanoate synthesis regulator phasin
VSAVETSNQESDRALRPRSVSRPGRRCFTTDRMKELISRLVSQADLSQEQAAKVADVVRGFIAEKVPESLRGTVEGALSGENVDNAFDQAKGLLGGFLK